MAAGKANVYEMVTARIIAELEKGNIPWEKRGQEHRPEHLTGSARNHILINQMLLIHTGEYATFKQWLILADMFVKVRNLKSLFSGRY